MAKITIECSVTRRAPKCYQAHLTQASGDPAITGRGESDKAARDDLARNLAWLAHVTPGIVSALGSVGVAWIVQPYGIAGRWLARRIASVGAGQPTQFAAEPTQFDAESWSKARAIVEAW